MSLTIEKLHEEIVTTFGAFQEKMTQGEKEAEKRGTMLAETRGQIEKINGDLTTFRTEYENMVKELRRLSASKEVANDDESPEMHFRKNAFVKMLRHGAGEKGRSMMSEQEIRALSSASDADGGFLVPPSFEGGLITKAYNMSAIRPLAQVAPTSRDTVVMGALSKASVAWGRQNIPVTDQTITAGRETITIFDLRALALISNNTLDDSAADIMGELTDMFSAAIAEAEDDAFAIGVGSESPKGVFSDSRVQANYKPSKVAAALSDVSNNGIDALIDALQGLKVTYRRNATWAFNSQTEAVIRKLKDGQGQYLWQPPVQAGAPATLLGRPVAIPEGAPNIAANAFPIVLGDFRSGYKIRDRSGLSIQRLSERYADSDQTGFLVKRRVGGQVVLPEAFMCVKIAVS